MTVWVHVIGVASRVVARGVEHNRRMALRNAHVVFRVARITVLLVRIRSIPVVVAEVGLGESHQHSNVVRGPENLRETQVRARFAPVVVRVDEVDPEGHQAQHALFRAVVAGPRRPDLGIVNGDGGEEDACPVQVEVPAVNPELPEPEPDGRPSSSALPPESSSASESS